VRPKGEPSAERWPLCDSWFMARLKPSRPGPWPLSNAVGQSVVVVPRGRRWHIPTHAQAHEWGTQNGEWATRHGAPGTGRTMGHRPARILEGRKWLRRSLSYVS